MIIAIISGHFLPHLLLGAISALLGYLIGRWSRAGHINGLQSTVAEHKSRVGLLEVEVNDHKDKFKSLNVQHDQCRAFQASRT